MRSQPAATMRDLDDENKALRERIKELEAENKALKEQLRMACMNRPAKAENEFLWPKGDVE